MKHLPNRFRPNGVAHRNFRPGIDLPHWFHDGLKAIDEKLYFVWHPWTVMYDDVMNQYTGSLEDPRFNIHEEHGEEQWGWIGPEPVPNNKWHIWRLCEPGWCHVMEVQGNDVGHLKGILNNLFTQAEVQKKGKRAWREHLDNQQEENQTKAQADTDQLFDDVQKENKWLMKEAMENYERGHVKATRPQKETISSGPWGGSRRRLSRDLTDEEGGLVVPDNFGK